MSHRLIHTLVLALVSLVVTHGALAQRGGGRAGRPASAGQGGSPSFNRTPSLTAPTQGARPNSGQAVTRPAAPCPGPRPDPPPLPAVPAVGQISATCGSQAMHRGQLRPRCQRLVNVRTPATTPER